MTSLAKGIIIGAIAVVVLGAAIMVVVISAGIIGWKAAVRSGNETVAVQNLRTVAALEVEYFNTHNRNFGTFDQLTNEGMLGSRFAGNPPIVDGYIFNLKVTPKTTNASSSYTLNADPESAAAGKNHFFLDSTTGTIHVNADQPARASDPPRVQ